MHTGTDHRIQVATRQDRIAELAPPAPRRRLPARRLAGLAVRSHAAVLRLAHAIRARWGSRRPAEVAPCLTVSTHSRGSR